MSSYSIGAWRNLFETSSAWS